MIKVLAIGNRNVFPDNTGAKLGQCFPGMVLTWNPMLLQGIEQARADLPELILLEDTLHHDGILEYCKLIRQDSSLGNCLIVLVSERYGEADFSLEALKSGADGLVGKPVREGELIPLLSLLVRLNQAHREKADSRGESQKQDENRPDILKKQLRQLQDAEKEIMQSYLELEKTKRATLNLMEDLKDEVDQRKRSEQILRESEKKLKELTILFRSISDNMVDMLWAKDLQRKYIFANKSICDKLLIAEGTDEPIGKDDMFFAIRQRNVHPENPNWHTFGELCRDSDQVVIDSGKPEQFDEYGNVKGEFLFLDVRKSPLYDLDGKMIGTVGSAQDRTVERAISKQLAERERQISTLVSNLPGMVYRCIGDVNGKMLFVSDGCLKVSGYTKEEFLENKGFSLNDLILEPFRDTVLEKWQHVVMAGGMYEGEYPIRTSRGEVKWVWERCSGVYDENHVIIFVDGYIEDITDRKAAEKVIQNLNDQLELRVLERTAQLEAANKELEAFSYSVSHDLRAPLRAIDGFTRILFEDYYPMFDEEGKRLCSVIQDNAVRMGQLIDDLLALSRLNRTDMHLSRINMERLAKFIYDESTSEEEKKRINFRIQNFHPAMGDNLLVKQVLVNLISNAIKFSTHREVAKITLSSEKQHEKVVYCISDNGAGFDMKYVDKLFGAFQRLHSVKEFDGTGIGLAIVQRIIRRHGGTVWAQGEVGKGASFYFSLPLTAEKPV